MRGTPPLVVALLVGLLSPAITPAHADPPARFYRVSGSVPLPGEHHSVVVDSVARRAYVSDVSTSSVDVVSTATDQVVASYAVGEGPHGVALDAGADRLYVANNRSGTVSVLVASTGEEVRTIRGFSDPDGLAVDPGTHRLFVASDAFLVTVDTSSNQVVGRVSAGGVVTSLAVDTVLHRAYATTLDDAVAVVDTRSGALRGTITVGERPVRIAVDSVSHRAYVSNHDSYTVSVIDTAEDALLGEVGVDLDPYAVTLDETTHVVYVGGRYSGTVAVIDANQGIGTVVYTVPGVDYTSGAGVDTSTHAAYFGTTAFTTAAPTSLTTITPDLRQRQVIHFETRPPESPRAGTVYVVRARGGRSGNRVLITTNGWCSILNSNASQTTVRLDGPDACEIDAHQSGNEEYAPAPTATQFVYPVARSQTIRFRTTPPDPAQVGSVYAVRARGGRSGNRVVFTVSGSCSILTINRVGAKVRFDSVGSCEISANQAGNDIYGGAPTMSQTVTVAPAR